MPALAQDLRQLLLDALDGLAARGLTNAEIADRLYTSPKTADHHVSAVLMKLGMPTRRSVIAQAGELGLV